MELAVSLNTWGNVWQNPKMVLHLYLLFLPYLDVVIQVHIIYLREKFRNPIIILSHAGMTFRTQRSGSLTKATSP